MEYGHHYLLRAITFANKGETLVYCVLEYLLPHAVSFSPKQYATLQIISKQAVGEGYYVTCNVAWQLKSAATLK